MKLPWTKEVDVLRLRIEKLEALCNLLENAMNAQGAKLQQLSKGKR